MKIIAHRGYSSDYPENTLLAFKKALEVGVDGVEIDLRLSPDGKSIIFHDDTLERIAGLNLPPEAIPFHELQKLDVGQGESIPSLDDILQLAAAKTILILEIKYKPANYKKLCEVVQESIKDKLEWAEVSCFEDCVLEYMHELNPKVKLHKLIDEASTLEDKDFERKYSYASYFDIDIKLKDKAFELGLIQKYKVIFWTVDKEDISKEKEAGLYGIMKNNPTQ